MPQLHVTMRSGDHADVDVRSGLTVMEAIRGLGEEEPFAICGGGCSCSTCHVYVDPAWLDRAGEPGPFEEDLLDCTENRTGNSRLSCQVIMSDALDGLAVTVAPADD